jgi:hypothetical protein
MRECVSLQEVAEFIVDLRRRGRIPGQHDRSDQQGKECGGRDGFGTLSREILKSTFKPAKDAQARPRPCQCNKTRY